MITIYHNPRCSKSRECETFLNTTGSEIEVINYIKNPFTKEQLKKIISLLGIPPIDLVRQNEAVWKEHYKGKKLTNATIINTMVKHPSLIQRPIVVNGSMAVIARPLDLVDSIL
jgi:arsenate reductase